MTRRLRDVLTSRRTILAAAAAGAALGAGALVAERRWRTAPDPLEGWELEDGNAFTVTTGDGAVLEGAIHGPSAGPMVVLSHCWTGSRRTWEAVAGRLVSSGHKVVVYDQRGHGSSKWEPDGEAVEISVLGADLAAVLEEVDARDAVIAGHSIGGMALMSLAVDSPGVISKRARGLGLVCTSARPGVAGAGHYIGGIAPSAVGSKSVTRAMQTPAGPGLVRAVLGARPSYSQLDLTRRTFVETPGHIRQVLLEAMLRLDIRDAVGGIDVPTVIVTGSRDALIPPEEGRELAGVIPDARLVEVPRAGHMMPLERPDLLAELLAGLAGHSSG
jgi:non-heme chloroperoxidase